MGIDGGIGGSLHPVVSSPILQIRCFHPHQMSSVQNPGWLFDIGDYTTQLYGDYNKPI